MARGGTQVRCVQCGAKNEADRVRCRICGTPTDAAGILIAAPPDPRPEPTRSFTASPPEAPHRPPPSAPGGPRTSAVVAAVITIVLVAAGALYLFVRNSDDANRTSTSSAAPPTVQPFSQTASSIGDGGVLFRDPEGYFAAEFPETPTPEQHPHPAPNRPPYTAWVGGPVGVERIFLDAFYHPDLEAAAHDVAFLEGGTARDIVEATDSDGHATVQFVVDLTDGGSDYLYVVLADSEFFALFGHDEPGQSVGLAALEQLKEHFRITG